MFLLRAVLNILVRNASPRGPMCLGAYYLVYQDLVIYCFPLFYCHFDMRSSEWNVVSLYVLCCPVNGSVCFVCVILLLSVVGGGLLDRPCIVFHRMCALCLWSD